MVLRIGRPEWDALRRHGEEAYPHECCGVLLGRFEDHGAKIVREAVRCDNAQQDSPRNRYQIDPRELLQVQRECRARGEDVVGFYHSHPDHPPQWSSTDLAEAHWFGCSYVITSVERGRAAETKSFALAGDPAREETKRFEDEPTEIE